MVPVGVNRAEQDGVLQDHVAVEESRVNIGLGAGRGNPGEAYDPVADVLRACLEQHLHMPGAFDDDVRLRGRLAEVSAVEIGCPQAADHLGFAALGDPVKHVGLVTPLGGQQGGEQPDRPGPGDQYLLRCPRRPAADLFDVVPGLGHDGGGFEQHAEDPEGGIHRDQVLRVNAVALGRIAVTALDPPLGVLAVHAHVPVPRRARRAGNRVTSADDADHQVPGAESGPRGRLGHPAQRFVPDDEAVLTRRC